MIKVLVKDIPRSVASSQVRHMLEFNFKVKITGEIKMGNFRNEQGELYHVKNCDRFCYIHSSELQIPLPRVAKCGSHTCRIFHQGQVGQTVRECYNCFSTQHFGKNCPNEKHCRVCRKPGHNPGEPDCDFYKENENMLAFGGGGDGDVLSNHYPCKFKYSHVDITSVEVAWFYKKAMLNMQPGIAREILESDDPKVAKRLSKRIRCTPDWDQSQLGINTMYDILASKFSQVDECADVLKQSYYDNTTLVEAVPSNDTYWGSAMGKQETINTDPSKWPGQNKLGKLLEKLRTDMFEEPKWNEEVESEGESEKKHEQNEGEETEGGKIQSGAENTVNEVKNELEEGELKAEVDNETTENVDNIMVNPSERGREHRQVLKVAMESAQRRYRSSSPSRERSKSPRSQSAKRGKNSSHVSTVPPKQMKCVEKVTVSQNQDQSQNSVTKRAVSSTSTVK